MNKSEMAQALFKEGFNCSQSILAAYGTDLGIERDIALKIAGAFGGGIGRMGETCGVVTGALMIIGLKYGVISANDKTAKAKTYEVAKAFVNSFEALNNSVKCRDFLGFDIRSNPDSGKIISRQCPKYVIDAVSIIEELL
jgi:C_GCAxxG_C_C family probable redox protein